MDLDFGHGFIPRIGSQNYKAVDRCLGADSLFDTRLDLPWAIVDAGWAEKNAGFLASLRSQGTRLLFDGSYWRYRYAPTFEIAAMVSASYAPASPIDADQPDELARFVRASMRLQAKLDANAYFVPGLMPNDKHEDLRPAYEQIVTVLEEFTDLPPKPFVLFVGAHSEGIANAHALLDSLPGFLSALYVQVSPTDPVKDSPTKLQRVGDLYAYARNLGLPVIAGHAGAITPALRAAGIEAADAGLASSEAFQAASARRPKPTKDPDAKVEGGPSARVYLEAVGRSFDAKRAAELLAVPAVRELAGSCRLSCHRFIGGADYLARAKEHSLRARIAEAATIANLPPRMRLSEMLEIIAKRRSTITAINAALRDAGIATLDTGPADNHLTWLARVSESRSAA